GRASERGCPTRKSFRASWGDRSREQNGPVCDLLEGNRASLVERDLGAFEGLDDGEPDVAIRSRPRALADVREEVLVLHEERFFELEVGGPDLAVAVGHGDRREV